MRNPYEPPSASILGEPAQRARYADPALAFTSGILGTPLLGVSLGLLVLGTDTAFMGLVFWCACVLGGLAAAVIVYLFKRISWWQALALGPALTLFILAGAFLWFSRSAV